MLETDFGIQDRLRVERLFFLMELGFFIRSWQLEFVYVGSFITKAMNILDDRWHLGRVRGVISLFLLPGDGMDPWWWTGYGHGFYV